MKATITNRRGNPCPPNEVGPPEGSYEREHREELARLYSLEEARVAREMRESQAFNDAMRRFEELQRRTVWQRIKAMFGVKP